MIPGSIFRIRNPPAAMHLRYQRYPDGHEAFFDIDINTPLDALQCYGPSLQTHNTACLAAESLQQPNVLTRKTTNAGPRYSPAGRHESAIKKKCLTPGSSRRIRSRPWLATRDGTWTLMFTGLGNSERLE
jgi:hypothetical protein